jgi:ABC-type multidrug transport system ATPase subunit
MDLIVGRKKNGIQVGDISLPAGSISKFQDSVAYVSSVDIAIGEFTVMQSLFFAAQLRLGGALSAQQCRERCRSVAAAVGIEGSLNTIIGTVLVKGISGGQMRRLSIATELLALPSVLCLDEPTTGASFALPTLRF